jgi:hypothetical protein
MCLAHLAPFETKKISSGARKCLYSQGLLSHCRAAPGYLRWLERTLVGRRMACKHHENVCLNARKLPVGVMSKIGAWKRENGGKSHPFHVQ